MILSKPLAIWVTVCILSAAAVASGESQTYHLTYTELNSIDPLTVIGSYAGPLGIARFMPGNILAFGVDGNEDGRIDLFEDADAISSIASYHKHYGWKPDIGRDQAYKVVLHYNRSPFYADTILKIANLLKEKS